MSSKAKAKAERSSLSPIVTPDPFARSPSLTCEREVSDLKKVSVTTGRHGQVKSASIERMASGDQDPAVTASSTPNGKKLHPYSNGYRSDERSRTARSPVGKLFPSPGLSPLNPSHSIGVEHELQDGLGAMRSATTDKARSRRESMSSTASRVKLDKVLGGSPSGTLACLYLVSGLGKDGKQWAHSDSESTRGIQPIEDSLGLFWRPDILGTTFSTSNTPPERGARKESRASAMRSTADVHNAISGASVLKNGEQGGRMVAKALKLAHPREVEVVNATLAPPTTCHAFTFTLPKTDTVSSRLTGSNTISGYPNLSPTSLAQAAAQPAVSPSTKANADSTSEITYYGVTMTVWTHADRDRTATLKECKDKAKKARNGLLSATGSVSSLAPPSANVRRRTATTNDSETEGAMSDSDLESALGRSRGISMATRTSAIESLPEDAAGAFEDGDDLFWMPYALTLLSRHPVYDLLQDFLKLSWARFSRNAKAHTAQVQRVLNQPVPRPGEAIVIRTGMSGEEDVELHGHMPGGLEYDQALVKVDFQMWPLFKALDVDSILTCVEMALSNSGRVVFYSKHPSMLNVAVNTLKYIVELRGWSGLALPLIHARDSTIIIEDPGPFIIGVNSESRFVLAPPPEVLVVDLDVNCIACPAPPENVVSRGHTREKLRKKLLTAFGHSYSTDFGIPAELKITYPSGRLRPNCRIVPRGYHPLHYVGERLDAPQWWDRNKVLAVFDRIMLDKFKKPNFYQRITKPSKMQPQLTLGEQMAKSMMRKRALHYIETRDDLELRISRINRRLLKLVEEGEHWKQQFEHFEKYADKLADEANELKIKIDRERRESRRLSNVVNEQTQQNSTLQTKLRETEDARTIAMRQLSDMHASIQELERERDEMMNAIETQLLEAMAGLPPSTWDTENYPGSPLSVARSQRTHSGILGRGVVGDTQSSILTLETGPAMSVLGAAGARAQKRDSSSTFVRSSEARSDKSMAERVASIQQKLEMALVNVTSHSRHSYDGGATENSAMDGPQDASTEAESPTIGVAVDESQQTIQTPSTPRQSAIEPSPKTTESRPPVPPRSLSRQSSANTLQRSKRPETQIEPAKVDSRLSSIPGSPAVVLGHKGTTGSYQAPMPSPSRESSATDEEYLSADEGDRLGLRKPILRSRVSSALSSVEADAASPALSAGSFSSNQTQNRTTKTVSQDDKQSVYTVTDVTLASS